MKKYNYILLAICLFMFTSCGKDFFDVKYTDGASEAGLKEADVSSVSDASLLGIFYDMTQMQASAHDSFGFMSILHSTDMMAGDILPLRLHWFSYDYRLDNHLANYRRTSMNWKVLYAVINKANSIITSLTGKEGGEGYVGQGYALRAFAYTYLIQLYQKGYLGQQNDALPGVPLYYAEVEKKENALGRNTVKDVLSMIEADLIKSIELLKGFKRSSKNFLDESVAKGLLARYYLLTRNWQKAADMAKEARKGYEIPVLTPNDWTKGDYSKTRYTSIKEADWMWGFEHDAETNTTYASFFSHVSNIAPGYAGLGYSPRAIDAALYNAIPDSDARKTLFNPQKNLLNYKFGGDAGFQMAYMYMRAPEMVLIEAEAYANLGQGAKAATVLKELMSKRDPSWNAASVSLEDVYLQRRIELWGEGFAYFDLKRLNRGIVRKYQGSNHTLKIDVPADDSRWVYQIPLQEIDENKFISKEEQNK